MKRKIYSKLCAALLGLVLIAGSSSASVHATPLQGKTVANVNSFSTKEDYVKFFDENNVPKDKQTILLKKLEKHELWDAYNTQKVKQIPKSFYEFKIGDKDTVRQYTFDDGSFIKLEASGKKQMTKTRTLEQANTLSEINSLSINGPLYGTYSDSYGISYWDYKISKTVGACRAWFYATFYVSRYDGSTISSYYGAGISGFGATGNPSFELVRSTEQISPYWSPAALRSFWFTQSTVSAGWGPYSVSIPNGSTCELWLKVGHSYFSITDEY